MLDDAHEERKLERKGIEERNYTWQCSSHLWNCSKTFPAAVNYRSAFSTEVNCRWTIFKVVQSLFKSVLPILKVPNGG